MSWETITVWVPVVFMGVFLALLATFLAWALVKAGKAM